jgi:dTDP-4-amino-4,6-dideoxygalactose transaminase
LPFVAIPHVDVRAQYAPLIGKLQEAFTRTLESGRFIFGPEVTSFEEESAAMLGVQECVSCANGTDALVLVLDALGIGPGDEVVCPAFTFYATAEAIARLGATPVFAEIDPVTLNLDPADVERRVTDKTKAIIPVHLFGRPAILEPIQALGLPVIEDAAQAFGADGIGSSIASTFSFFPTKNLFALGDGGLIGVNDPELAQKLRMLRFHGSVGKKDFVYVGYNSRLDAMQAAFLRIFLKHIERWNEERREAADRYRELLDGVVDVPVDEPGHVYHQFCVRSPERDRLAEALAAADISTARYYEPPLHLQPALAHLGYSAGDFPVTEQASRENLCLPIWAGISEDQQREVVSVLQRAVELVVS